jgi:hypothetical protein
LEHPIDNHFDVLLFDVVLDVAVVDDVEDELLVFHNHEQLALVALYAQVMCAELVGRRVQLEGTQQGQGLADAVVGGDGGGWWLGGVGAADEELFDVGDDGGEEALVAVFAFVAFAVFA